MRQKQGETRGRRIERRRAGVRTGEGDEKTERGEKERGEQLKDDCSPVSNSASPVKSMRPT